MSAGRGQSTQAETRQFRASLNRTLSLTEFVAWLGTGDCKL